ncbi:MAG: XRE family transcriptional regulator [Candidatus Dehalobacter alkaniphilus]
MNQNRETLASNIKKYMKLNDKTQIDLSNDLSVSPSSVSDWLNGKKYPRIDRLQQLADYFNVYKSDLTELKEINIYESKGIRIPVLGIVPCGIPIEAVENVLDYEEISQEMARNGVYFGLHAKGDSMSPIIENGDTLIIRQQSNIESGQVAIIKVNGDEATCKKVYKNENGITLLPANKLFNTVEYNPEQIEKLPVLIIGRVVEIRRSL